MNVTDKPKIDRIVWILMHLIRNRTRKYTSARIHRLLNNEEPVSLRNVQRDLKKLVETPGSSVVSMKAGREIEYFIEPDMRDKLHVPIQRNAMLAMFMLKRLQPFFASNVKTVKELADALDELSSGTEDELFFDLNEQLEEQAHILGEQSSLSVDPELLDEVLKAFKERKMINLTYRRDMEGNVKNYTVCPVKLLLVNNELYLVSVFSPEHSASYYFKLNRIVCIDIIDSSFTMTESQMEHINNRMKNSFGIFDDIDSKPVHVELLFPSWFEMILHEKRYHSTQKISKNRKGDIVCSFKAPIGHDLIHWILGWGDQIRVRKPKKLISQVKNQLSSMLSQYS